MKNNKIISLVAVASGLLLSGCAFKSNNVTAGVKTEPYRLGNDAIVTTEKIHNDGQGKVTTDITRVTKTGPEVASELDHHRLDVVDHSSVAKAKASRLSGFVTWLCGPPAYPYYGNGYSGGGYYGNSYYGGGGHFTTSYGEGGRNYVFNSGGGGGPTFPRPNDGGGNYIYHQ